ncbi:MAG: hypothetical protein WCF08_00965 [Anaerolineaceae bacterium]
MFKLRALLISSLLLLVACASQAQTGNTVITIGVTTNLSSYRNAIYNCSLDIKQPVKADTLPLETLLSGEYDAVLQVGQPTPDRLLPLQVGEVRLVFIINPQNPLTQMNSSQLAAILLGMVDDWQMLAPSGFSTPTAIKVWSYPAGDDVRKMVESLLLEDRQITPRSFIAPDDQAMVEAISNDPAAIGYSLDINPRANVKSLPILPASAVVLAQPVIASFSAIPEGDLKDIMACLSKQGE